MCNLLLLRNLDSSGVEECSLLKAGNEMQIQECYLWLWQKIELEILV